VVEEKVRGAPSGKAQRALASHGEGLLARLDRGQRL